MSERRHFRYESVQDLETIIDYLQTVADGFKKGSLVFNHESDEVAFHPQGLVGFTVDAKLTGPRRKLTLKFGWKEEIEEVGHQEPLIMRAVDKDE